MYKHTIYTYLRVHKRTYLYTYSLNVYISITHIHTRAYVYAYTCTAVPRTMTQIEKRFNFFFYAFFTYKRTHYLPSGEREKKQKTTRPERRNKSNYAHNLIDNYNSIICCVVLHYRYLCSHFVCPDA